MADDAPSWREGVTDEAVVNQLNDIRAQVTSAQPLVGEREAVAVLLEEYDSNASYLPKIGDVIQRFAALRRMRGDGNCFYRALLVGLGEAFVHAGVRVHPPGASRPPGGSQAQASYDRILDTSRGSLARLVAAGYPKETTCDFVDVFQHYIAGLGSPHASVEAHALGPLRADDASYAIYCARLLTALEIRSNPDEYLPYIMGTSECVTVEQFCEIAVLPPTEDADMVQVRVGALLLLPRSHPPSTRMHGGAE